MGIAHPTFRCCWCDRPKGGASSNGILLLSNHLLFVELYEIADAIAVLEIRFERVPAEVMEAINRIEDTSLLKQLLRQVRAIPSIDEFQQLLAELPVSEENSAGGN